MDTIKNIFKPGGATDDETLYGSGTSTNPAGHPGNTGNLGGEGSHLSSAKATGPVSGEGSHFSNTRDATNTTTGTSNLGSSTTTAGPHSSNLANKADPRVDSDLDGSQTTGNTNAGYGSTTGSSVPGSFPNETVTQNPYSSRETDPRLGDSSQTSTGIGSNTTQTGLAGQNTGNDHHYARDGAALGGAAAVGEGVHHHRENERAVGPETTSTVNHPGGTTSTNTKTATSTTAGPHSSSLLNKLDPRVENTTTSSAAGTGTQGTSYPQDTSKVATQDSGHHYGRDVTALGGAAAVGEGIHHHRDNERENLAGNSGYTGTTPSGAGTSYYGAPSGTAASGPHDTATANRLDPSVNTSGAPIGDVHQHHHKTGGGSEQADQAHGQTKHHHGRDAAGVGAAGVGAHELSKHHEEKKLEKEQGYSSAPGHTLGTTAQTTDTTGQVTGKDHHYGRDAAGVGAAGVGAHELSKHHDEKKLEKEQGYSSAPGHTLGTTAQTDDTTGQVSGKDHHYGRDAAGVGAAGIGAHELSKHHEEKKLDKEQGYDSTTGTTVAPATTTSQVGSGADPILTGPVHRSSLLNKLDPRVKKVSPDSTADTLGSDESNPTTDHHYGRDAAGVGAAGVGAHELSKHHKEKELEKEQGYDATGSSTGDHGRQDGLSEHEKLKLEAARNQPGNHYGQPIPGNLPGATGTADKDHHYGRDAAGAGVVGAGAYEAEKHHGHHHSKDEKVLEKEQGHGASSGHITSTGGHATDKDHHYGRDAAGAGVVGTGAYEAEKHHGHHHTGTDTNKALPAAPGNSGIGTGEGTQNALDTDRKPVGFDIGDKLHGAARNRGVDESGNISGTNLQAPGDFITGSGTHSHVGRDAALGAGAGGLGASAYEHEHHKKATDLPPTSGNYTTSSGNTGYDNTTSGYGSTGAGSQIPRNSALDAGATQDSLDNSASGHGLTSGGRNKLHKDPPHNHPAAQGGLPIGEGSGYGTNVTGSTGTHVPAGGAQRDQTIGQGVQGDSGVVNPHDSNNLSKNY